MRPISMLPFVVLLCGSLGLVGQGSPAEDAALRRACAAAKLSLVDAVNLALAKIPGQAISAQLLTRSESGEAAQVWEVVLLASEAVHELRFDAATGGMLSARERRRLAAEATSAVLVVSEDSFESEALSAWRTAETNGSGDVATWRSVAFDKPWHGSRALEVESKNAGQTYNLLLSDAIMPADLDMSVRVQGWKGDEDQGGGLVWRAKDAANYWVARWNPMERNLRVYTVIDGKRSPAIKSATFDAAAGEWHELRVNHVGAKLRISFDGELKFEFEDPSFPAAGKVGFWTKADASTRFDDFRYRSVALTK
jgi:hypothetical protein